MGQAGPRGVNRLWRPRPTRQGSFPAPPLLEPAGPHSLAGLRAEWSYANAMSSQPGPHPGCAPRPAPRRPHFARRRGHRYPGQAPAAPAARPGVPSRGGRRTPAGAVVTPTPTGPGGLAWVVAGRACCSSKHGDSGRNQAGHACTPWGVQSCDWINTPPGDAPENDSNTAARRVTAGHTPLGPGRARQARRRAGRPRPPGLAYPRTAPRAAAATSTPPPPPPCQHEF